MPAPNCNGCVWYNYEKDTGFAYCTNEKLEEASCELVECDNDCSLYYNIDDAKADSKYGQLDYY